MEENQSRKKKSEKEQRKLIQRGIEFKKTLDNKRLYICTDETWPGYVIRVIDLGNLLMSPSSEVKIARQEACLPGSALPTFGRCGVLGSKIVFAGGKMPNSLSWTSCKSVYAFDIHDPEKKIVNIPQTLNGGKENPVMFEFSGELYVLSCRSSTYGFEVFDPNRGTWSTLPPYPDRDGGIPNAYSYALAGSKLFVSIPKCPIRCFDLAAHKQEWKRVRTKPFPFFGKGLVLDLEQNPDQKLLFALERADSGTQLVVYVMSFYEDQEGIAKIFQANLPAKFPNVFQGHHFFHLGGNHVCLVNCAAHYTGNDLFETVGAAMLIDYDICKKKTEYSIAVKFQHPHPFGYDGVPKITPTPPRMLGCFVL